MIAEKQEDTPARRWAVAMDDAVRRVILARADELPSLTRRAFLAAQVHSTSLRRGTRGLALHQLGRMAAALGTAPSTLLREADEVVRTGEHVMTQAPGRWYQPEALLRYPPEECPTLSPALGDAVSARFDRLMRVQITQWNTLPESKSGALPWSRVATHAGMTPDRVERSRSHATKRVQLVQWLTLAKVVAPNAETMWRAATACEADALTWLASGAAAQSAESA